MTKEQCDTCQYPAKDPCRILAKRIYGMCEDGSKHALCGDYKKA